jgi:hypothetical protein
MNIIKYSIPVYKFVFTYIHMFIYHELKVEAIKIIMYKCYFLFMIFFHSLLFLNLSIHLGVFTLDLELKGKQLILRKSNVKCRSPHQALCIVKPSGNSMPIPVYTYINLYTSYI